MDGVPLVPLAVVSPDADGHGSEPEIKSLFCLINSFFYLQEKEVVSHILNTISDRTAEKQ